MSDGKADVYAEMGLLASIIVEPEILNDVVDIVTPEDFNEPRNEQIYSAILEVSKTGEPLNTVNIAMHLRNNKQLTNVGGMPYLAELAAPESSFHYDADGITYALIVKDESIRRNSYTLARDIANMSKLESGFTSEEMLTIAGNRVRELAERSHDSKQSSNINDISDDFLISLQQRAENPEPVFGIPSGLNSLDDKTTGFLPGQFVIIAARPAVGKSTLAVDFARAASIKAGFTTLMFSLEMSKDELMARIFAAESNVELNKIRKAELSEQEWSALGEAKQRFNDANLIINDTANITIESIRAAATKQSTAAEGLDFIVVDYLQLMKSSVRIESRQQEVSAFSRELKLLAKELGVPIVALSQLNRGPENRTEKEPKMSDLRESGSLEQDADIVILLHAVEGAEESTANYWLILAKNRNGETCKLPLAPLLAYARFADGVGVYQAPMLSPEEEDPEAFSDNIPQPPNDITEYEIPDQDSPAW